MVLENIAIIDLQMSRIEQAVLASQAMGLQAVKGKFNMKHLRARKASYICMANYDKEGAIKWLEKAKDYGLKHMEYIEEMPDDIGLVGLGRNGNFTKGASNSYRRFGQNLKEYVDTSEQLISMIK